MAVAVLFALSTASYAQEKLTILWAQWDPANYLQELVKDYQKETGVEVVVETTPWPDFQTKAFTEWNAHGVPTTWWSATRNGWARVQLPGITLS
jgi:multiple sugar transport system substrate-binding protein